MTRAGWYMTLPGMEPSEAWDDAEAPDPDDVLGEADDDETGLPVADEDRLGIDTDDD